MEIRHFKSLLSELKIDTPLHYHTGRNNFIITELDIEHSKITVEREAETSSILNINFQKLLSLGQKFEINKPIDTEVFFGSSGNDRSVLSGLAANTREIYSVKIKGRTNIVWCPQKPHEPNQIVLLNEKEFEHICGIKNNKKTSPPLPLQQIFYGAPGTGKSHTIKRVVEDGNLPHIRTTFHPDSDYSTFVGAYKPTTIDVPMRDVSGHIIVEGGNQVIEKKIIYTFVPQAFLKAYVAAWSNLNEPFFLIIEEINRGNCAQIFGDLFQLLDRNSEGISDYPVTPDDDIRKHLKAKFSELDDNQRANIPDEILSGEEMLLPQNFHIWATMNTSDQSLFPIDSAFKRRWDWKYTPIANGNKDWKITADGKEYDWWQFLEKINAQIDDTTHSEDKKLGYYFCKPINDQTIDAETFVSKVVFYLWNDVFKDFAEDAGSIFNDEDGTVLSFNKFYTTDADGNAVVVEQKVTQFLQNLGVDPLQDAE